MFISLLAGVSMAWADLLSEYRWKNRLLIGFIHGSMVDHNVGRLHQNHEGVSDRDLLYWVYAGGRLQASNSDKEINVNDIHNLYHDLQRKVPVFILIGKDGLPKLIDRKLDLKHVFGLIDAMPMRQEEMKRRQPSK
jgi:hypothetical protein